MSDIDGGKGTVCSKIIIIPQFHRRILFVNKTDAEIMKGHEFFFTTTLQEDQIVVAISQFNDSFAPGLSFSWDGFRVVAHGRPRSVHSTFITKSC